jgi:salicylate hydroxylase
MVFSYDAEEHAEEWWNDWGILQERADDAVCVLKEHIPVIVQIDHDVGPARPETL